MADVDVLAIHDAQPMVEASVLGHAVTQTLESGLGCNAAIGLPTQQADSYGEADTGAANYTFVAQPGCADSFTVSALNILQVLASPSVDAHFAVDLRIGDAYSYSCACEPGSTLDDIEESDSCSPFDDPNLRCTVDEVFLGEALQESGGDPNVLGGCPMLLANPSFTTEVETITLSASSEGRVSADNTDARFDDQAELRALISTSLEVYDHCGNTAGVVLEPSEPVRCGGRGFGDPPPEVDCDFPQWPEDGDYDGDGDADQDDMDAYQEDVEDYWECVDDDIEDGPGEDAVSISQSYLCEDLCMDDDLAPMACRVPEEDESLCHY